jgi:carotenoid cleavage dioxygenase
VHRDHGRHLPRDDRHPYRTGAWRPQHVEVDAWHLPATGDVPRDISGVYLRNTENPLFDGGRTYHPFDGDGMLHSLSLFEGELRYCNRFVRTAELEADLARGRPPRPCPRRRDAASTDVVVHRGVALASTWRCGRLHRLDPVTLADLGTEDWQGRFPREGVSAHAKVDAATGELLFFNYGDEPPYMHFGIADAAGRLARYGSVPLPGPRFPHDMAFTERYAVLSDPPLFASERLRAIGVRLPAWHPELPTRFAVVPRHELPASPQSPPDGAAAIRWFEAAPTYVLHLINAWEDGEEIVLDGYFQHAPPVPAWRDLRPGRALRMLDLSAYAPRPHRWRFDLATGATRESPLAAEVTEFGQINRTRAGRAHRYTWSMLLARGAWLFEGVMKHDSRTGAVEALRFGDGIFGSETVMAPRTAASGEDDGYLLTFVTDLNRDASECWILDAARPADGPLCRIALPARISSGTHACWAGEAALDVRRRQTGTL